jgi:S-DNA-T family DNA segregation ATPase FtsK/SpoIIIE
VDIVLAHGAGEHDLDVVAEHPDATVADLLASAVAREGDTDGLGLLVDGRWLAPTLRLDEAGLYEGARARVTTCDGDDPHVDATARLTGLVVVVTGGPAAGQAVALDRPVTVGRSPACDLVTPDPTVSTCHARFDVTASGRVTVTDLGSRNGTVVDGALMDRAGAVPLDTLVQLGATEVRVRRWDDTDRHLAVDPRHAVGGVVPFNRPPRAALPGPPGEIAAPDSPPGDEAAKPPFNALALVAPLIMAGVMVALYGSLRYAMFGLLSPIMALGNWLSARRRAGREFKGATRSYRDALGRLHRDLAAAVTAEVTRREVLYPDAAEVTRRAHAPSVWLWERRPGHADFLSLRVGTGDMRWTPPVARARGASPPAEVAELGDRHGVLPLTAVDVGLADGPVGIVGDRASALALARSLVCQAAVHHGPADVTLAVLTADGRAHDWDWAKWLPHARLPDATGRLLAAGRATADALVAALWPADDTTPARPGNRPAPRAGRPGGVGVAGGPGRPGGSGGPGGVGGPAAAAAGPGDPPAGPVRLFVVDDPALLQGRRSPLRDLLRGDAGPATAIVIAPTEDQLPHLCTTVVTVGPGTGEAVVRQPAAGRVVDTVVAAGLTPATARATARALARFEDPELGLSAAHLPRVVRLPGLLDLGDLPGADEIAARWRTSPVDPAPATAIGLGDAGVVTVDLVADGPHALVGGTTGSGKSELLRSLVAGMAAGTDPDHLVFVLVDYKGGSAFDACARLPHVVGMVTDLDEHLGQRALRSLEAEVTHRERRLREAGAADLPTYLAAGAPLGPLPRLVVVVDEFAAMATELPDFLGALVGVAQRGRSLGIHLVLATQRPRGAVNADIKANTNLRIALRVQDPGDSVDIIDRPDAAMLPRATPGRAVVRRGPGEVEVVQTAWATATAGDSSATGVQVATFAFGPGTPARAGGTGRGGRPGTGPGGPGTGTAGPHARTTGPDTGTGTGTAGPHARTTGPDTGPGAGGPSDLDRLVDAVVAAFQAGGQAPPRRPWLPMLADTHPLADLRGLPADRPGAVPFALADDPDHQRQVAVGWVPAEGHLALFGMVGSGTTTAAVAAVLALCAGESPDDCHVYGIDYGGGFGPLAGLPHTGSILGAREREAQVRLVRELRSELDRRRDLAAEEVRRQPLLVCVVDGVAPFLAEYPITDGTDVAESFGRLVADGPGARIVLVLTGDRVGALPLRLGSSIGQRMLFRLADRNEFATVGIRPRELPRDFAPGRCVHGPSGLYAQVGDPGDVAAAVAALAAATDPPRRPAPQVATLPRHVDATTLPPPRVDGRTTSATTLPPPRVDGRTTSATGPHRAPAPGARPAAGRGAVPVDPGEMLVLPVGLCEADLRPAELRLTATGHALVAGAPRSGVSSALALLARQARVADPDAVIVAVCDDHAPLAGVEDLDAVGAPADLARDLGRVLARAPGATRRWLVLIDDAPTVGDPHGHLAACLTCRRPGLHLVAGGHVDDLRRAFTHWSRPVRSARTGVLLDPNLATDGDLLGVKLPRRVPVDLGTGRGFVVTRGQAQLAQLALLGLTAAPGPG